MKSRILLAVLLAVVLAASGVCVGAYKGLSQDRADVETEYGEPLKARLALRYETAVNLIALSKHYTVDDALRGAVREADYDALPGAFTALLTALQSDPALASDPRDATLLGLLRSEFVQREADAERAAYLEAAKAFNERLASGFQGFIARQTGVTPLPDDIGFDTSAQIITYPSKPTLTVYDGAGVLSAEIISDAGTLSSELQKKLGVTVYVATVNFMSGQTASKYVQALAEQWTMGEKDILLVMSVGDRASAVLAGTQAAAMLDNQQNALQVEHFDDPFTARQFDTATRAFLSAVSEKLSAQNDIEVETRIAPTALPASSPVPVATPTVAPRATVRPVRNHDDDSAPSVGSIIVLILLVIIVLGRRGGRVGCGCFPFSGLLSRFQRGGRSGGHHFGNR